MKKAFILGITGQDGSYLAELLLGRGYHVHGLVRRASMFNRARIEHLRSSDPERLTLHYGELSDLTSFRRLLSRVQPDELYHLAGQSHVGLSFEIPEATCQENGLAALHLLEIVRDLQHPMRVYFASSSEIFGATSSFPQCETTPLDPINPYGCAKAFATQIARVYRKAHGVFVVNGITYNHESPRRGENFVTRKITLAAARLRAGAKEPLRLGNLDAVRDWGYAPEYVEGIWQSLQAEAAGDYVFATGQLCSVREFAQAAFAALDLDIGFAGSGVDEVGRRLDNGETVLRIDPVYYRPVEATLLVGDASRARTILRWAPRTVGPEVARVMALADWEKVRGETGS
ncbi:MAG: GDP-mannose 4,6-dehydratase [Opitutus sp.]|nr:GDP-mannose 4,6-dehydratase [Opitutus sp.]